MIKNDYIPFSSKILEVIQHTNIEYTFRMEYQGDVKPGQFFEVSIPKYGEAPISVSGVGKNHIDLTIRRVGKVTNEIFERYVGNSLLLRGPYGNGFNLSDYMGKDLIIMAGGTGLSPVRGVIDYFFHHPEQRGHMTLISGFKTPKLENCFHIVSTNSTFVSLSNFERSIARFIVSSLLALKTI